MIAVQQSFCSCRCHWRVDKKDGCFVLNQSKLINRNVRIYLHRWKKKSDQPSREKNNKKVETLPKSNNVDQQQQQPMMVIDPISIGFFMLNFFGGVRCNILFFDMDLELDSGNPVGPFICSSFWEWCSGLLFVVVPSARKGKRSGRNNNNRCYREQ